MTARNFLDYIWGIVITICMYVFMVVFFYQVVFNYEDINPSILLAIFSTFLIRYILSGATKSIDVDFNIIREILTVIISGIITYYIYKN